jgi:hypothetical protein
MLLVALNHWIQKMSNILGSIQDIVDMLVFKTGKGHELSSQLQPSYCSP